MGKAGRTDFRLPAYMFILPYEKERIVTDLFCTMTYDCIVVCCARIAVPERHQQNIEVFHNICDLMTLFVTEELISYD